MVMELRLHLPVAFPLACLVLVRIHLLLGLLKKNIPVLQLNFIMMTGIITMPPSFYDEWLDKYYAEQEGSFEAGVVDGGDEGPYEGPLGYYSNGNYYYYDTLKNELNDD